jgi:hypothetical protein
MDTLEVAMQLTLQAIEKGFVTYDIDDNTEARAKEVATAFKVIYYGVNDAVMGE